MKIGHEPLEALLLVVKKCARILSQVLHPHGLVALAWAAAES